MDDNFWLNLLTNTTAPAVICVYTIKNLCVRVDKLIDSVKSLSDGLKKLDLLEKDVQELKYILRKGD